MMSGVSPVSQDIYHLHMAIFWICAGIAGLVFGFLIYALFHHRKSRGHKAATFHTHSLTEWIWSLIPLGILILMAIPATLVLKRMDNEARADLNIKITGYQWKWKYDYPDQNISFFSNLSTPQEQIEGKVAKNPNYLLEVDKPLVIPIHKKIRFLVTSNDVIHSWWVPAFGVKRDAIPGFIHEAWVRVDKPGTYRGQCAELCGKHHAFMPIVVIAKTQADFDQWVAEQTATQNPVKQAEPLRTYTKEELMLAGKTVYESTCAVCHQPTGVGMPPTIPAMKGSKIVTGPVADHIHIVMNGKPGTAMQAFKNQLSNEQIAAVITYERNSWGNNAGIVQPEEIRKAR
jgi:cytochrome c oxidase subunit 2